MKTKNVGSGLLGEQGQNRILKCSLWANFKNQFRIKSEGQTSENQKISALFQYFTGEYSQK